GKRDQRANAQSVLVFADLTFANLIQATDLANIYQSGRTGDAISHQVQQIYSTGLERSAIGYRCERLVHSGCIDPFKAVHAFAPFTLPRAARTAAGRMGNWRTRTPTAL